MITVATQARVSRQRNAARPPLFYVGTFALQEALWGLEHGDREAFDSGITAYR